MKVELRSLVEGDAQGPLMLLGQPLSFWGGVDPSTGDIIERDHPRYGDSVAGRIVVMPHGRGSSSASSVLAELLRRGCGPAALVMDEPDAILVVGSLVARSLYGTGCPIAVGDTAEIPSAGRGRLTTRSGITRLEFSPANADRER